MKKSKSLIIIFLLILSFLLSMTGCGSKQTTESSGAGKTGGSIVIGITNEPDNFDPHIAVAAGTREILFNLFEGLVKPDPNGNLIPAVAKSYNVSPDALTYTFKLRTGVKFHNGNAVTAQDVKYSLDRAAGLGGAKALVTGLENIKAIEIKDNTTVDIKLKKPDNDFLPYLTVAIIPKGYTSQSTKPVGTGPFEFVSYTPQQQLVLKKNPDYWQKGLPHLDSVTFKIESDLDTAFLSLQSGAIDIFPYLSADKADQLKGNYDILQGNANVVQMLALNNASKPFDNIKVRQALCYTVNSQDIISTACYGYGTKITTGIIPGLKKYYQDANTYKVDITKAKQLLKEAGYPNGFSLTITVPSNYKTHVDTAQVIVNELKQIGINAAIKQVDWGTWLTQVYQNRQYQATVIGVDGANLSPRSFLARYVSSSSTNFIQFKNKNYDQLYSDALNESNDAKRIEKVKSLEKILTDQAASVYIQDPAMLVAVKKGLTGYKFYPLYVQDMSLVYYTK